MPSRFESGARKLAERMVPGTPAFGKDAVLRKRFESLASQGRVGDIVRRDYLWVPYAIDGLLSDEEKVARSAYRTIHEICAKRRISSGKDAFKNPILLELFNSSQARAGEYGFWSEWLSKEGARETVALWRRDIAAVQGAEDPSRTDWDDLLRTLRAGGGFDEPNRPEGAAFARVRAMGSAAYPYLIRYIDNEDLLLGRGAARTLNELTGRQRPIPTDANKLQVKREWETYAQGGPVRSRHRPKSSSS